MVVETGTLEGRGFAKQPSRAGRKQSHLLHSRHIADSILLSLMLLSQMSICFWLQNVLGTGLSPELGAGSIPHAKDVISSSPAQGKSTSPSCPGM